MNLKSVKSAADVPFKGVELIKVDNGIREVVIGGKLRIKSGPYGTTLEVLVEQPFEEAKRYRVRAETDGFPAVVEHFEHSWDADERVSFFRNKGAEVSKEHVDVLLNDAGDVVRAEPSTSSKPATMSVDEDLPF